MRNTTIHLVLIPSRSLSPGVTITLPNTPCDRLYIVPITLRLSACPISDTYSELDLA